MTPSASEGGAQPPSPPADDMPKADIACLVCRSRKVRCDRGLPDCRNCVRLGIPCPRYNRDSEFISRKDMQKSADDIFKAAGVEKRRVGSCEECRSSKHRCTKTRPSCRRCILRNLPCVYPNRQEKHDRESSSQPACSVNGSAPVPAAVPIAETTASTPPQDPRDSIPWSNPATFHVFGVNIDSLYTDTLPKDHGLRLRLINAFFERTHHLRNLSFIHRPSFLQSFDRASVAQDYGEPLLYVMCALGARHIYFDALAASPGRPFPNAISNPIPGQAWTERARGEVLGEIHAPTIHHLMTAALLCEYGLREDRNALVFILSAFLYRAIRLLSLDSPRPLDNRPSASQIIQRESENRLVWASYYIDILIGTGVDKNMCWKGHTPDIPLPCPDQDFLSQSLSPPHYVVPVEESGILPVIKELDLSALAVLVIRLRARVMQLIRVSDPDMRIWESTSEYMQIIEQLKTIYNNLPEKYYLSELNIYILKDKGMLGAVFAFHLMAHAVLFDLTRISLAGFNFPLAPAFKNAPPEFRSYCQDLCRFHAGQVSEFIRKGMAHGRAPFDDIFCADAALESAKIQIIYAATVNRTAQTVQVTRENININLAFLLTVNRGKDAPRQFIRTLLPLCNLFGFRDIAERYQEKLGLPLDAAEVTGSADIHHLSGVAAFRRGVSELQGSQSANSVRTISSSNSQTSPLIHASRRPMSSTTSHQNGNECSSTLRVLRPTYTSLGPSPELLNQTLSQRNPLQIMPSAGAMVQSGAMLQPSVDDYIKTADEMSPYLTWNMPDMPQWLTLGDHVPS